MVATNKDKGFMEGRHARLLFVQNSVPKSFAFKTWTIKPNVTKHNDGVNGEKRDRLSKTLNFYELTGQMFKKDANWIDDWLEAQDADDANTAPLDQEGAIRFNPLDGTRRSFILDGLIWDEWDLNQGGRGEKMMVGVSLRFEDLVKAKAI